MVNQRRQNGSNHGKVNRCAMRRVHERRTEQRARKAHAVSRRRQKNCARSAMVCEFALCRAGVTHVVAYSER